MELVKSKGMVIFLVVVLGLTIISSINTKKYDERNKDIQNYKYPPIIFLNISPNIEKKLCLSI